MFYKINQSNPQTKKNSKQQQQQNKHKQNRAKISALVKETEQT